MLEVAIEFDLLLGLFDSFDHRNHPLEMLDQILGPSGLRFYLEQF